MAAMASNDFNWGFIDPGNPGFTSMDLYGKTSENDSKSYGKTTI